MDIIKQTDFLEDIELVNLKETPVIGGGELLGKGSGEGKIEGTAESESTMGKTVAKTFDEMSPGEIDEQLKDVQYKDVNNYKYKNKYRKTENPLDMVKKIDLSRPDLSEHSLKIIQHILYNSPIVKSFRKELEKENRRARSLRKDEKKLFKLFGRNIRSNIDSFRANSMKGWRLPNKSLVEDAISSKELLNTFRGKENRFDDTDIQYYWDKTSSDINERYAEIRNKVKEKFGDNEDLNKYFLVMDNLS